MSEALNAASADQRRELLRRRLARRSHVTTTERSDSARLVQAPLSHGQRRLWLADQVGDPSADYNVPLGWWLDGPVDTDALHRALEAVTVRHDILRTRYRDDGEPRQVVGPPGPLDWAVVDLSGLPTTTAEAQAALLADNEAAQPFDLAAGPVLRARLYRTAEQRQLLTIVVHHIAFDGWSASILERELGLLYGAFTLGDPDPLPAPSLQYADVAAAQRLRDEEPVTREGIAFWSRRLDGLRRHDLPADRPRPAEPDHAGSEHSFVMPPDLATGLEALARRHGATLFMALLAAYHLLLARRTGSADVATGTAAAQRDDPAHEALIGYFVDVVVLRSDVSAAATFSDLLREVRRTALDGFAHRAVPFERVVEAIGGPAHTGHGTPFFQSLFGLHTAPRHALALPGIEVTERPYRTTRAVYDLALSLVPEDGGLRGHLDYSTELFDEATIVAFAAEYVALLAGLVEDPDRPLERYEPTAPATAPATAERPEPEAPKAPKAAEAVPDPDPDGPEPTPLERVIAETYAELLGLERFGVHDDLRAAGADSLVSVRMAGRLREALGVPVPLRSVVKARTVADLATYLGKATPPQGGAGPATVAYGDELPLSPAQQSIWFLTRLRPDRTDYLLPVVRHIDGPLDAELLHRALDRVVARQEAFRAVFGETDGRPAQRITASAAVPWRVHDLRGLAPEDAEAALRQLTADEAGRPFDLTRAPLIRGCLLRTADTGYTLVLTAHHIVFDGWSIAVLLADLDAEYRALLGLDAAPPALPVGYAAHAAALPGVLDGPASRARLAERVDALTGAPALALPASSEPHDPELPIGGRASLVLPAELTRDLQQLADAENTSIFTVLLAAGTLLLGRLAGQRDLLVGVPFAGRSRPELDRVIGMFLNTLVVRADLSGKPSFRALLERTDTALTEVLAASDVPFEQVVEAVNPPRVLDRTPLVDVLFNFDNTPTSTAGLGPAEMVVGDVEAADPKFPLTVYCSRQADTIRLEWVFRTDVLGQRQVAGMAGQLGSLLAQIAADPDACVERHSLRTPDSDAVLPQPDAVRAPHEVHSVVDQFRAVASRYRDLSAITHDGVTCTYGCLGEHVRDIAAVVARLTAPGEVVALRVPPSPGLAAAMLGVLAAGRTLLVVDPALPAQRTRLLLDDAGARLVLGGGGGPTGPSHAGLDVEPDSTLAARSACEDIAARAQFPVGAGDSVGYLAFTSGSTGVPKGVAGSARGLARFLAWQRDTFAVGPGDRIAQLTALSFDVLYRDVLLPLVSGATLDIPPAGVHAGDPERLFAWMRSRGTTRLHTVPSVARSWLAGPYADRALPTLRTVFFAGEPLSGALVDEVRHRVGGAEAVNLYGPTETTLAKLAYRVPPGRTPAAIPVGHPLPDCQALLLNPEGVLCGVGEPGEVVLRTPDRSLGYLSAPPEERARFLANPFTADPADILYRTGDQGRYRPDGTLELLGRLDGQLKVRGVRIEPGEIEAQLCRHPAVTAAVITVLPGPDGPDGVLTAWLEVTDPAPNAAVLRGFLAERLPDYLVPGAYFRVERIPTTASGKTDRRALAALPRTQLTSGERHQAPRTPTETLLADVWRQVLGTASVGIHDNFFDLGGDSLRLVHVTSLLRDHGVPLDVRDHYEHQTVATLGQLADARTAEEAPHEHDGPLVRLSRGGGRPLFCVHPGGGSAAWYTALARAVPADRPVLAFELPGAYGPGDALSTIEDLAACYVDRLRKEQPTGPYALLGWSLGGLIAFEMARQLTAAGHRVDPLILLEPTLPQDPKSTGNHRTTAELYGRAEELVAHARAAPQDGVERRRRLADVAAFFAEIGWPPYEAELAGDLPLRACRLMHAAFVDYRPSALPGTAHIVLSREGRDADPDHPSGVLHDSAERYIAAWGRLVDGAMPVHHSGLDHMAMIGPGNGAHLTALCEELMRTPPSGEPRAPRGVPDPTNEEGLR
ncbi:amino acid adenylation domain-containing protein [Streptomyces goshikiensis]|uniref:amino acid adenylation domain-containing protein n=1 Tax=Streptomyces goshikiensis TaxID=1942 RepID=UPI00369E3E9D